MDILEKIIEVCMEPLVDVKLVDFVFVLSSYQERGYNDALFKALYYLKEHDYGANIEALERFVKSLEAVD